MLAIGNGEKCPFCDGVMVDFKIKGLDMLEHMKENHEKEFMNSLFGDQNDVSTT